MIREVAVPIKMLFDLYPRFICSREFRRQSFERFNERSVEYSFVFRHLARTYPRKVLDVGTGISALPNLMQYCGCIVTAIDNVKGYWSHGMVNRHYHIINDDITDPRINEKFDLITCISVLEHIQEPTAAMRNMLRFLNPDGHLVVTFPYTENSYAANVYELAGSSYGQNFNYICQSFSRKELSIWVQVNHAEIIEQEYWQFWDGDYWTLGHQLIPPRKVAVQDKHQMSCVLIRKKA